MPKSVRRVFTLAITLVIITSCGSTGNYTTTTQIKPKNYNRPYNPKKDKRKKRTKKVERLIINQRKN